MNRSIKEATVKRFHYESHDQLRKQLADFIAADVARKYDPVLAQFRAPFRARLLAQSKPKMVFRIALASKLLVKLNAKVRDARLAIA